MSSLLKHRGPDDEGFFADQYCILGHRRLSIIDLSRSGRQPFASKDGNYQLVFNGEIYNYIELREELKNRGHRFYSNTDTEVLLASYREYGPQCLQYFNGMFAFAIYDNRQKTLFIARDRFGIKPLYYTIDETRLTFASEIKALLGTMKRHPSLHHQTLFDYLVFNRTDVGTDTFHHEIKRFPKGHYAMYDGHLLTLTQWWNPETYATQCRETNAEKAQTRIAELLVDAVQLRMRSDVVVGSCLSGGLDSSIMTGILFQHHSKINNFQTFTASFPGHPIDETTYVKDLNCHYPFKSWLTYPCATDARDNLESFVYSNDEPTTNPSFYSQYEVMRLAQKHGVSVLLDGQGADEIFAGYQYFHGFYLYGLLKQRKLGSFFLELWNDLLRKQHISAYQTLLFQLLPDRLKKALLLRTVPYLQDNFFYEHIDQSAIYNNFFKAEGLNQSLLRHFQYKLEHLLRMEDRNSMAFSIEARVPYLDNKLVEYIMGLSEEWKIRKGETKYLQKKALKQYTIKKILDRKDKIGFGTPGDEWMNTKEWRELTRENHQMLSSTLPEVFKKNIALPRQGFDRWKINQLAVWKKIFQVS